ncbi:FadR family transcriptional regulator (plasmid) [Deinococcus sp. QL22]|nr:FadR family transcriptional regulator [Deinococcus sp. QL22]
MTGHVLPLTRLPKETELAEEFDVSRVVIREAMKVLAEKGLVEIQQGRGTTVNPAHCWNPMDPQVLMHLGQGSSFYTLQAELLEARMVFEIKLAGLAATRMTDRDLGHIESLLRTMDHYLDDPERFSELDAAFHVALIKGGKNTILAKLLEPVHELLKVGFRQTILEPGAAQQAQVFHWAIYDGLKRRDPVATQDAIQRHLIRAQENLQALGEWLSTAPTVEAGR